MIAFAALSALTPVFIDAAKHLESDGASKLMDYKWGDWLILAVGMIALALSNLHSFFSTKWADHKQEVQRQKSGNTEFLVKPPAIVTVESPAKTETTVLAKPEPPVKVGP